MTEESVTYILNKPGPYTVGSSGETDDKGCMIYTASEDALTITLPLTVWTLVVRTADSRYIAVSVHSSEQDAKDALVENHGDEEWTGGTQDLEEFAAFYNLDVEIDPHPVTL
jgi:hypothetical protein